jgi:hypothetical protein
LPTRHLARVGSLAPGGCRRRCWELCCRHNDNSSFFMLCGLRSRVVFGIGAVERVGQRPALVSGGSNAVSTFLAAALRFYAVLQFFPLQWTGPFCSRTAIQAPLRDRTVIFLMTCASPGSRPSFWRETGMWQAVSRFLSPSSTVPEAYTLLQLFDRLSTSSKLRL